MAGFRAIFLAYDSSNAQSVWVTDGTDAGTVPLSSPLFGSPISYFLTFTVSLGNAVLFSGVDTGTNQQLFRTDGTTAGTSVVGAPGEGQYGLKPQNLARFGTTSYFAGATSAAAGAVWSLADGSASASILANQLIVPTSFAEVAGTIYSTGYLPNSNTVGIYRYDSGPVASPLSLSGFSRPDGMMGLGTRLLFRGDEPSNFTSLFSYDTLGGTVTELSSSTGVKPFLPVHLTALNGYVYFEAATTNAGGATTRLWRTDGTSAGTEVLSLPGIKALATTLSNNQPFPVMGGRLMLGAVDTGNKDQLFVTDGTAAGTTEVTSPDASSTYGLMPSSIAAAGDTAVMSGMNTANKTALWRLDGGSLTLTRLAPAQAGSFLGFLGFQPSQATAFSVACFLAGTRILTLAGAVPVERLAPGSVLVTRAGGGRPVRWIGHRRIDCRRHPDPDAVHPVRIEAGAFAPGAPVRDLWLSPDHAVLADGVLIPVRYLINGTSIRQMPRADVTYYHVELDAHDVILAEGLPCESYLDTGNRADFDNSGGLTRLHPDFARQVWNTRAAAPLVIEGSAVTALRRRLLARAANLGHATTGEHRLHLRAAGRTAVAQPAGRRLRFHAPPAAGGLRLVSRSVVPAQFEPDGTDHRRLGVAIAALSYAGKDIALDDPRLGGGWHPTEGNPNGDAWRWTDGDARLHLPGGHVLEVELRLAIGYWLPAAGRARARR